MKPIYLKAISIIAPGIKNWKEAKAIFNEEIAYEAQAVTKKLDTFLAPNTQRRASRNIQLALASVQQICLDSPFDSEKLLYVFTSCNGDLTIFHQINSALNLPGHPVSPTKFHNSVHNAPAGYTSIALNTQSPSTSIASFQDSFANGLLEATVQSLSTQKDCLLVAYDEIPPEPLLSLFPVKADFSCAFILSTNAENALCRLDISITKGQKISSMKNSQFERLRHCNPQAKVIPLLHTIACKENQSIFMGYNQLQLKIKVSGFSQ
ncbi:MAG: beta-ketoacyl synthase chain length factor [Proteobacteria bacterium]|nr:beta-ketoacyl synthase chain length factor [Pseudomonadota bacterium]